MPFVNVKLVKQQVDAMQKQALVDGLMDIVVNIMHRDPQLTVITIDELDQTNWMIGGKPIHAEVENKVIYVEIKISKGTSNSEEMSQVIKAGKEMITRILGSCHLTNYFVINELNPDGWGFDGISMTVRNKMEADK
jgi:4-oxalocrotonate tautomerase